MLSLVFITSLAQMGMGPFWVLKKGRREVEVQVASEDRAIIGLPWRAGDCGQHMMDP